MSDEYGERDRDDRSDDEGGARGDDRGAETGRERSDAGATSAERLARRAVASVMRLVRRGLALAGGFLIITLVVCGGGFVLGYAALSDGMQTLWIMIGGFFAILAIGANVLAIVRLLAVRTKEKELVAEIAGLITDDPQSRRTVIETIEVSDAAEDEGVVVISREFETMQRSFGGRLDDCPALRTSLTAVTSLPFLVFVTLFVSLFFAALSAIFALALLL